MNRLFVIVFCAVLCSCQLQDIEQILSTAERQLESAPDSALTTIRGVKFYSVLTPARRARYGLIHSAALDKNFIDVTSDSLIRFSTRYYDYKGTPEQRMRSYYYLGRVLQNGGQEQKALLSFYDAAQYADQVDDNYLKGLLFSRLGVIYRNYYNYDKAFGYFEHSYNCYKAANLKKHQAYQLCEMGVLSSTQGEYALSILQLNKALELSEEVGFHQLIKNIVCKLIITHNQFANYDESYKLLKQYEKSFDGYLYSLPEVVGAAADTFAAKGYIKRAKKMLEKGWSLAKDKIDSMSMQYYEARVLIADGDDKKGYRVYAKTLNEHLLFVNQHSADPFSDAISEYFAKKTLAAKERDEKIKMVYLVLLVSVVIGVVIATIYNRRKIKYQNRQIDIYRDGLESAQRDLMSYAESTDNLISQLFGEKFEIANDLCCSYYENKGRGKQQVAVFKKVETIINEIGNDDRYFAEMERLTDLYKENILSKLKQDFPDLSCNDYKLACYMCLGFSTQALCLFFSCSAESIYNRKSRLRDKIRCKSSEHQELYRRNLLNR